MAYAFLLATRKQCAHKRSETVGESHTGEDGNVEKIVDKRSGSQRVGGIMPHHDVVGKTDSYIPQLPDE